MRKLIAIALAKHMGEVLSPDVAIDIARTICDSIDCTIDVNQFEPIIYGDYKFSCELMRDILPELHTLHEKHYLETEVHAAGIEKNFDYETLLDCETKGGLLQFTARLISNNQLVGNMRVFITTSTRTQTLIATEDTYYVLPEFRGGFMAVRLWQYVEKAVIKLGVREICFDSKLINNAGSMARYLKYKPVATKFIKVIDHVQI